MSCSCWHLNNVSTLFAGFVFRLCTAGARRPLFSIARSASGLRQELATLDFLETQIESAEQRLEAIMKVSVEADVLKTLPCVGKILSMVLMLHRHSGPDLADRPILLDNARRNPASGSRVGAEI